MKAILSFVAAMIFSILIFYLKGHAGGMEYLSGYLIELSLSVDNLFVFMLIFRYFKVPREAENRVLFWGIIGAVILRGAFILAGVAVIEKLHWLLYILGALLTYSAITFLFGDDDIKEFNPDKNKAYKLATQIFPSVNHYYESRFSIVKDGIWRVTPLFFVLILIETTDLIFAFDSIPAVFGITTDRLIIFTSNLFAVLALRSIYQGVADLLTKFRFLSQGLGLILAFIGLKMLFSWKVYISTEITLVVVVVGLVGAAIASRLMPEKIKNVQI